MPAPRLQDDGSGHALVLSSRPMRHVDGRLLFSTTDLSRHLSCAHLPTLRRAAALEIERPPPYDDRRAEVPEVTRDRSRSGVCWNGSQQKPRRGDRHPTRDRVPGARPGGGDGAHAGSDAAWGRHRLPGTRAGRGRTVGRLSRLSAPAGRSERYANIRRSPLGSGMGSPNSLAASIHRSVACLMLPRAASCVSPCAMHPGSSGTSATKAPSALLQ